MFTEFSITSNFTFLTGASHPEEYMERAALLGYPAIAIADINSVAGIVRAHSKAQEIARQVKLKQAADIYGPTTQDQDQFRASAAILNIPSFAKPTLAEQIYARYYQRTDCGQKIAPVF